MTNPAIGKDKQRLWCILPDTSGFYAGGYKALSNAKEDSGLLPCLRSSDNGRIKLSYDISGLRSLSEVLPELNSEGLVSISRAMTRCVITIQNNPFLNLETTCFQRENVFISGSARSGYEVKMIYLPIAVAPGGDEREYVENYFRFLSELIRERGSQTLRPELSGIDRVLHSRSATLEQLEEELNQAAERQSDPLSFSGSSANGGKAEETQPTKEEQSGSQTRTASAPSKQTVIAIGCCAVAAILGRVAGHYLGLLGVAAVLCLGVVAAVIVMTRSPKKAKEKKRRQREKKVEAQEVPSSVSEDVGFTEELFTPSIRLTGQNTPVLFKLEITKPDYVIGRSQEECDGIISFSKTVGRNHCRILYRDGINYVVDNNSRNKTRINGRILNPGQEYRIQVNDTLQLAELIFRVEAFV